VVALVALGALAGAVVQSSSGLGFGLVLGPIAFAVLEPEGAVVVLVALGLSLNVVLLLSQRRRPDVAWREVVPILIAAVPGAVCGVLLLQALPKSVLQLTVGLAVIAATLVRLRVRGPEVVAVGRAGDGPARVALGLGLGTLTTSVGVAGPPLALWLARHGLTPSQMRDSLAAAFLGLGLMGVLALLPLVLDGGDDVVDGRALAGGLAGVLVGHVIGSRLFARLDARRYEPLLLGVVLAAGLSSAVAGVVAMAST
jgi:uncharacterized membrane protein YfcA